MKKFILIAAALFIAGQIACAAEEQFTQTDWSGGQSATNASHPGDKINWNKYFSKTSNVSTAQQGLLKLNPDTFSFEDDADSDFIKGALQNVEITGTGDPATLGIGTTYQDPFCSSLGQWTNLPMTPYMGSASPMARAGSYIYSLWIGGDYNKTFMRWSIVDEKWEKMADIPMSCGVGAALAYDGTDIIYAMVGGGRKNFYAYKISTATWYAKKALDTPVNAGAAIIVTPEPTQRVLAFCGNGNYFYRYFPPANIQDQGSWNAVQSAPWVVSMGSSLVYPGSGEFIFGSAGNGSASFAKYQFSGSSEGWTSVSSIPFSMSWHSEITYPGAGSYLYAMKGDSRYFARYDIGSNTWESSYYPSSPIKNVELPGLPFSYSGHSYLYDALGDGTEMRLLTTNSYSSTYRYYPGSGSGKNRWREESALPAGTSGGTASVYVASENAIYFMPGGNYKSFYKYYLDFYAAPSNLSVSCQWETAPAVYFNGNNNGVYIGGDLAYKPGDNYIYCLQGYNYDGFSRYDLTNKVWAPLAPLPQKVYWGGSLVAAGNYIYATGGYNNDTGQYTNIFYRYDPSTNTWTTMNPCSFGAFYYGACMAYYPGSDYIYVLRTNSRSEFMRYRISTNSWERLGTIPDMSMGYGTKLVAYDADTIYFFNGHDWDYYSGFAKYTISSNSWQQLGYPAFQNTMTAACASASRVFYLNSNNAGVQTYNPATGLWNHQGVYASYSPGKYYYGSVVVKDDFAYLFFNARSNYAWKYSISQNKWVDLIKLPFLPLGYGHKAVYPGSGNYIYLSEGNYSRNFWRYNTVTGDWEQRTSCPVPFTYGAKMVGSNALGDEQSGLYVCPGVYTSTSFLKFQDNEAGGSWSYLTNLLDTISSEGNGMCLIPSGSYKGIYLVRQNGTNKFTKYSFSNGSWSYLCDTPWAIDTYSYIIYPDSGNFIYCVKGGGRDFAKYDLVQNAWTILNEAPISVGGGAGGYYPGTGDIIYFYLGTGHGVGVNFNRYSISENRWDEPVQFPAGNSYGAQVCPMPSGEEIFYLPGGNSSSAYKYNIGTSVWYVLNPAPVGLAWDAKAIYPGTGDNIYICRGDGTSDFWKYSESTDYWTTLAAPPYAFSTGVSIAYYNDIANSKEFIYTLRGGGTNTFLRYSIADNQWVEKATAPTNVTRGANLVYPGSGSYLYACAGGGATSFWRYRVPANLADSGTWETLSSLPLGSYGGVLFSPGFGDYLYYYVSYNYDTSYGSNYFYRYSITTDTWETLDYLPLSLRGQANAVYPGTGDYIYLANGYGTSNLMKYLLFSSGLFVSDIKEIGNNSGFGLVEWSDNSKGQIDVKVRTGRTADLSDATGWSYASKVLKNSDLSSYPSVHDKDTYLQYRLRFFCYDLTQLPVIDWIKMSYSRYPLSQELVSSAFNSTADTNRLRNLTWHADLPAGTDVRFQMRTALDSGGVPGTWSSWLGPAGIQQVPYEFVNSVEYAKTSEVVVSGDGKAKLSKILADYLYRQRIVVDNSTGSSPLSYNTIKIDVPETNIDFWSHVADDGSDMRFVDSDGKTPLSYRVLGFSKLKKSASAWVTVPLIPANSTKDIYLLYGKSTADSESNPTLAESLLGTDVYAFMLAFLEIVSPEAPNRVYIDKLDVNGQILASTTRDFAAAGQKIRYDDTDLTVYRLRADKPIAVFTSAVEPSSSSDDDWYTVCGNDLWLWCPSNNYDGDVIITAYSDDTQVKITDLGMGDDTTTIGLDKGNFWFGWNKVDSRGEVWHIESTKPVTVMAGLIGHGEANEQIRSPDMKEFYFYCPEAYITITAFEDNTNIIIDNLDSTTGDYSGMLNKGKSYKHIPNPPTSGLTMRTYVWADKPICVMAEDIGAGKASILQSADTLIGIGKEYYFNTIQNRYLRFVAVEGTNTTITIDDDVGTPTTTVSLGAAGSSASFDSGSAYRSLHIAGTNRFALYTYGGSWGEAITPVFKPTDFNYQMSTCLEAYESPATSSNPALSGWQYKETINVDNTANDSALTDFQIAVEIDKNHKNFWTHCRADGADVRFLDSDDLTPLNYYMEYFSPTEKKARFWVKLPALSNAAQKTLSMYYGKADAVSLSDGSTVFEFFDDFNDGLDQWNAQYCNLTQISAIFGMDSTVFNLPAGSNSVSANLVIPTAVISGRNYDWYWELRWPTNEALVEAEAISQPFTLRNSLLNMTDGPFMTKNIAASASLAVSSTSWDSNVATVNTAAVHNLEAGQRVAISGVTPSAYNGNFIVASVVDTDTFTVSLVQGSNPGAGSGGTVRVGNKVTGLGGTFTNNETYDFQNVRFRFTFTDVDIGTTFSAIDSSTFTIPKQSTVTINDVSMFMPALATGHLYYWSWQLLEQDNGVLFSSSDAPAALFNITCGFAMTAGPNLPSAPYTGGSTRAVSATFQNDLGLALNNLFWRFTMIDTTQGGRTVAKIGHNGYLQAKVNVSPDYNITTQIVWQAANKTGRHFVGISDPNAKNSTDLGSSSYLAGYDVLIYTNGYYYDESGNGYTAWESSRTPYTATTWNTEKLTWWPHDPIHNKTGKVVFELSSGDKLTYNAGFVAGPGLAIKPTVRSSKDTIYIDKIMIYKSANVKPYVGFVFSETPNPTGMEVYYQTNPVVQPVLGVFYDNNLSDFTDSLTTPANTGVRYQVSSDGYNWYWWDSADWTKVTGGYSQTNTALEIKDHLAAYQVKFPSGEFWYRAYLHSNDGINTPEIERVTVTTTTEPTFYLASTGNSINLLHQDTDQDRWFQYKAVLSSVGTETPLLNDVTVNYVTSFVRITAPDGGEVVNVGQPLTITWQSQAIDGATGKVKLEYSVNNGQTWTQIATNLNDTGSYQWTIPDDPSQNALIRISSVDFPAVTDVSDASFRILALRITSPNGAEIWEAGKQHAITWQAPGAVSNNLTIEYTLTNGLSWTSIRTQVSNTGSFNWSLPSVFSDEAKVRITDASKTSIVDTSDAVFAIVPPPSLTIASPAGGEMWKVGVHKTLAWHTNSSQFNPTVDIEYSRDEFMSDVQVIAQGVSTGTAQGSPAANTDLAGTYDWTVPNSVSDTVKVRIRETAIPAGRDTAQKISGYSNGFAIVEPTISVSVPSASDVWIAGDTRRLTWASEGTVSDDLKVDYSVDNGVNWQIINAHSANGGLLDWTIPAQAVGNSVYVRITDNTRTQVQAQSAAFRILAYSTIELVQPRGGEQVVMGENYEIKWNSWGNKLQQGGSDYLAIAIYYSLDNGQTWALENDQQMNDGTYTWLVPTLAAENPNCRIKIVDANDALIGSISGTTFTIGNPSVTVTWPNGGQSLFATGSYNITWTSRGAINPALKFEYSANGGSSWITFAQNEVNDGTYAWTAADVNSSQVLVRITDVQRPVVTDTSDTPFTIVPPTITLTSPNGAEEWVIGTQHQVTWTSVGKEEGAIRDNLTLQYSSNSGSSWNTFATNELNDGSFLWTVPDALSNNCLVKILDATRLATVDTSNAVFKIVLPYIEVIAPNGGESWPIGTSQEITWKSVGAISNNLTLLYSKDNFSSSTTIATGVNRGSDNGEGIYFGSYTWSSVNDDYSASAKLRIRDQDRPAVYDDSNAYFSIAYPIVKVTRPNGGELLTVGDSEKITWQNTGSVGNSLKIDYSKDNFATAGIPVNANVANSSPFEFSWTIPNDVSADVRVRITDNTRPVVWDKSDSSFTILPIPQITIVSPAAGSIWHVGENKDITWTDNGGLVSNNLLLEYRTSDAGQWKTIASGVSNTGKYTWKVPDDLTATAKVRITDSLRVSDTAISEAFSIVDPVITIQTPNGGEVWAVGDKAMVLWSTIGGVSDALVMQYSADGGSTYNFIATVANSGAYLWTVPDIITSNAMFKMFDAQRQATIDYSDGAFTINPLPTITVTSPNGGEELVLGDAHNITWTWTGLSISNNLVFEISNDNFVNSRQVVASGVPNTGTFSWTIPVSTLTGSTLKIRITDGNRTVITDKTDGFFRIRGGFAVISPNGGENWVAKSPQDVTWQTRGTIAAVNLEYTLDNGTTWNPIASGVSNTGTYRWTLPDPGIAAVTAKVRVSDPNDSTVTDSSDGVFNIIYASVRFNVTDFDSLNHLSDFSVSEPWVNPAKTWTDSGVNSPINRVAVYPYGTYTTFFTKNGYIDNSATWSPPKSGTDVYVIAVSLENSASAQVTWDAILTYSYSPADDTISAVGSLQRKGKLVGVREEERQRMGVATLTVYEPDGTTIRKSLAASAPNTSGMYTFTYQNTAFEAGKVYPATLSVVYNGQPYTSTANIDVGAEKLQYEFFTQTAEKLAESVEHIETTVVASAAQTAEVVQTVKSQLTTKLSDVETNVKSHVDTVLASTETKITDKVEEAKQMTELSMKSAILNTESTVKSGESLIIRYRTYPGLSPVLDVYNAVNAQKVSKARMKEASAGSGIYEYSVKFESGWGKGTFTIVCSESTKGSLDALAINVVSADIESISSQVSAIMGSTSSLSKVGDVAANLDSQFTVLESAISRIGKDVVTQVSNDLSSGASFTAVYDQLSNVARQVKEMAGEATNSMLEKLYKVSSEKKGDIVYLKNKTQELKAAMELSQKLIENIANKPVTQTWYEYQ